MPEHREGDERPFFSRVRVWDEDPDVASEGVYLEVTPAGDVLAFGHKLARARMPGGADHGFPWLHLRARSRDGGRTWVTEETRWWEPETRAFRSSVVDATTGDIFLFNQGTYPLQDDAGQPMSESWLIRHHELALRRGGRLTMARSRDGGRTWDTVDVTDLFFTYPGAGLAWFIGTGIQLRRGRHAGRLLVPARYFTGSWQEVDPDQHRILYYHPALGQVYDDGEGQVAQVLDSEAHNAVIYSDDHGETWRWGGSSQGYVGEACIVELADGAVYMNNRNHDPRSLGYRSWCISRDGGESFTEFGVDRTLIEGRCHAALTRYPAAAQHGAGPILFSNPASFEGVNQLHTRDIGSAARRDLTVRVSYDECRTWPVARRIDEDVGYSSLVVLDDGTILCGYGAWVCRFNLAWLEDPADGDEP